MQARTSPLPVEQLLAISRALAGHIDTGAAFRATADEIGKLIPHDHIDVAVLLRDPSQHVCYEVGVNTTWSRLAQDPLPTDLSPVRAVLLGEVAYLLSDDALVDPRFHFPGALDEPIFSAGLRSRIIVPLRARGKLIGTLDFSRHEPSQYTLADVEMAQYCADFIAPYINALIQSDEARRALLAESEARNREEVLRVGASRLAGGMERERRRIAMDLHDQTLADLSRIAREVASLNARGSASGPQLAALHGEIVACLTELRRIVDDMRPAVLELFGLRDAIEAHLTRATAHAEPPIATRIEDASGAAAERLAPETRTALYRIIQEAINNSVRHARPSQVCVRIENTRRALRIEIKDDGIGCSGTDPDAAGGIGHMRTRASLIGAQLRIGRADREGGTRVALDLPWPGRDDKTSDTEAPLTGRRGTSVLGNV